MLLSAVSVLVVAQSSSKIPEGLMNNPVFRKKDVKEEDFESLALKAMVIKSFETPVNI